MVNQLIIVGTVTEDSHKAVWDFVGSHTTNLRKLAVVSCDVQVAVASCDVNLRKQLGTFTDIAKIQQRPYNMVASSPICYL